MYGSVNETGELQTAPRQGSMTSVRYHSGKTFFSFFSFISIVFVVN